MNKVWDWICKLVLTFLAMMSCLGALGSSFFNAYALQKGSLKFAGLGVMLLFMLLTAVLIYAILNLNLSWYKATQLEKIINRLYKEKLEDLNIITELHKLKQE